MQDQGAVGAEEEQFLLCSRHVRRDLSPRRHACRFATCRLPEVVTTARFQQTSVPVCPVIRTCARGCLHALPKPTTTQQVVLRRHIPKPCPTHMTSSPATNDNDHATRCFCKVRTPVSPCTALNSEATAGCEPGRKRSGRRADISEPALALPSGRTAGTGTLRLSRAFPQDDIQGTWRVTKTLTRKAPLPGDVP